MSSQKGNAERTRAQKYQNERAFKNDLHDKTAKIKFLNTLEISDVCSRCRAVLEWKIQYKKYKLLSKPRTCIKCSMRNVTLSYRVMCSSCAVKFKVCPKCIKGEGETNTSSANINQKLQSDGSKEEEVDNDEE